MCGYRGECSKCELLLREMRWQFSGETEWKKAFFSLFFKLREGGNEEPVLKRHDPTFSKHIQYDIQNMVNL